MATKPTPATVKKAAQAIPAASMVKTVAAPKASKLPLKPATATKPATKSAKQVKPKPQAKVDAKAKVKKPKLVRDSFTIPKPEYLVLDALKARANAIASPAKKGELLRAGIKALAAMPDAAFLAALKAVPAIKTGRPVTV